MSVSQRKKEENKESFCEIYINPLGFSPFWLYLKSLINDESLPCFEKVMESIKEISCSFYKEMKPINASTNFLYQDWIVDTSFLKNKSAFDFNIWEKLFEVAPFCLYVHEKVEEKLEELNQDQKDEWAGRALSYLKKFARKYPENFQRIRKKAFPTLKEFVAYKFLETYQTEASISLVV